MVAGLSCEIMNSELLYKCSVCKCQQNEFSTVVLADFFKHIELNHQYLNWNRMCDLCSHKLSKNVDQYYLKDALEHLISYHMVLKKDEKPTLGMYNFKCIVDESNLLKQTHLCFNITFRFK